MVRLKDVGKIITGNTPKTSEKENYESNDICFVKPSDIESDGISYIEETENFIAECAREKARILPVNSVLVTCIGIIGKIGINKVECAFNQQINAIVPNEEICLAQYLAYAIKSKKFLLQDIANAPVVPILNKTQFADVEIKIVDLKEQESIVHKLAKVEALLEQRKQQLQKLDELVKARFVEMFGDPVRDKERWQKVYLSEVGNCKNGMNYRAGDEGIEINCLGVGEFKSLSIIDNTKNLPSISLKEYPPDEYLLKDEDIVFVRSNGNKELVGRCVVVYTNGVPTTYSGFCIRYRIENTNLNVIYLLYTLKSTSIRKLMSGRGANIQNLNQQMIMGLEIPLPPIELQNQFADFVQQVNKSKLSVQKSLEKLETLNKALMQKYFG